MAAPSPTQPDAAIRATHFPEAATEVTYDKPHEGPSWTGDSKPVWALSDFRIYAFVSL